MAGETVHNCANKFMDILAIMIDHNPILTDMFFGFFFLHSHSPSSTIVNSACEFWNTGYLYVYMYINGDGLKPMIHSILGGGTSHLSQLNFGGEQKGLTNSCRYIYIIYVCINVCNLCIHIYMIIYVYMCICIYIYVYI